jgi:beta-glucosidase
VAAAADVAIVFTSAKASEGSDRKSLYLSNVTDSHGGCGYPQEELITAVAAFQPKTVVVMAVPGPILTEWRDSVPSILCAFLPGEQYGNAIADLIFGNTVPQAKLPVTMPLTGNDQVRWPLMTLDWPRLTSDDRSQQPCLAPAPARA